MTNHKHARQLTRRRPVQFRQGADGTNLAFVTLKCGSEVTLLADDYQALLRLGVSPNWFLNKSGSGTAYVRTRISSQLGWGNVAQVARLIAQPAARGVFLRYADGNRLNLRRDNLIFRQGRTRAKAWERQELRDAEFWLALGCSLPDERIEYHTGS